MKTLLIALLSLSFIPSSFAHKFDKNIHTTAVQLYLRDSSKLDITTPEATADIEKIENELKVLFEFALTDEGKKGLTLPLPWEAGVLMFKPIGELLEKLSALTADLPVIKNGYRTQKRLDVATQCPLENPVCKQLADLKIQTVVLEDFGSKFLFDSSINPEIKVDEIRSAFGADLKWIEPNRFMVMGGKKGKELIVRNATEESAVYTFNLGGGDCPAGCFFYVSHSYQVSLGGTGENPVSYLGRDPKPSDDDSQNRDLKRVMETEERLFKKN